MTTPDCPGRLLILAVLHEIQYNCLSTAAQQLFPPVLALHGNIKMANQLQVSHSSFWVGMDGQTFDRKAHEPHGSTWQECTIMIV